MTIGSQMPELDRGASYKIGCQNTPYKLGLKRTRSFLPKQSLLTLY